MRDGGEGNGGVCRRFGLDVIPSYAEKCDALRRVLVDGRAARARVVEANLRLVVVEGVVHAAPSEPNVSALGTRGKKRMSGRNARKSEKYSFPCKNVAREHLSLTVRINEKRDDKEKQTMRNIDEIMTAAEFF